MTRWRRTGLLSASLAAMTAGLLSGGAAAETLDPKALITERCASCHTAEGDESWKRISHIRKTPEGWEMTLFRMGHLHDAKLSANEATALIRYLSDTQGLAPAETADYRYILERQPNVAEAEADEGLVTTCARCHSFARVALQRRDADEWLKLAHFHVGQFPTAEYQFMSRDHEYWKRISTETPKLLGDRFPYQTAAWTAWKDADKPDPAGTWIVSAYQPGRGALGGSMTVAPAADGTYTVTYDLADASGQPVAGGGLATVFGGYEWRASTDLGGGSMREVMALSEDGTTLSGRMFQADADEIGARVTAVKADGQPTLVGLSEASLKAGESKTVTLYGDALPSTVDFGPGITVAPLTAAGDRVTVKVTAAKDAAPGWRTVKAGGSELAQAFAVYKSVDSVKVEPETAVARVGGGGGAMAAITAQLEAVGYLNGADGQPGTDDDVRLGALPAAWAVANRDAAAEAMEDAKFALTSHGGGLFQPALAGPNPQRRFGTNNVGDLAVTAAVKDGGKTVSGEGRLVVTVQRWNDPPIH